MKSQTYTPHPIDTTSIVLPNELEPLIEAMAKNVHEVWAQGRIDEGWTYGPERNDAHKNHPCLVPYEKLPEPEKEYDRIVAINTIKLLKKLGWKIIKN